MNLELGTNRGARVSSCLDSRRSVEIGFFDDDADGELYVTIYDKDGGENVVCVSLDGAHELARALVDFIRSHPDTRPPSDEVTQ